MDETRRDVRAITERAECRSRLSIASQARDRVAFIGQWTFGQSNRHIMIREGNVRVCRRLHQR